MLLIIELVPSNMFLYRFYTKQLLFINWDIIFQLLYTNVKFHIKQFHLLQNNSTIWIEFMIKYEYKDLIKNFLNLVDKFDIKNNDFKIFFFIFNLI